MHATRVVTFLLGAWVLGTLCVDVIAYMNWRLAGSVLENAPPEATTIVRNFGPESAATLLQFFAAESDRRFVERWETVTIALGLILVPAMFFATDRKLVPTIMATFMLALALFQYFTVQPELGYRTRQVDFPPGRGNQASEERAAGIAKIYLATDGCQVLFGTLMGLYVMTYRSRRRTQARRVSSSELLKSKAAE